MSNKPKSHRLVVKRSNTRCRLPDSLQKETDKEDCWVSLSQWRSAVFPLSANHQLAWGCASPQRTADFIQRSAPARATELARQRKNLFCLHGMLQLNCKRCALSSHIVH